MKYKNKYVDVEIPEWIAEQHDFDTCFLEGRVIAETADAIYLEYDLGEEIWLPISQIKIDVMEEAE